MKKVLIAVVALVGLLISSNETKAQAPKFGFFDFETMLSVMPGYPAVDSMLQVYRADSLAAERVFYASEFNRLDSTFRADSAAGKPKNVLDLILRDRYQAYYVLATWSDYEQERLGAKRDQLAGKMMQDIFVAYKKVVDRGQYVVVLNPQAIEPISLRSGLGKVDNLFVPVAKELKIQLPAELGGGQEEPKTGNKPTTTPKKN